MVWTTDGVAKRASSDGHLLSGQPSFAVQVVTNGQVFEPVVGDHTVFVLAGTIGNIQLYAIR